MKKSNLLPELVLGKLKKVRMFEYLSNEEVKLLLDASEIVQFDANEKIIEQGKIHPYFYVMLQGTVEVKMEKGGKSNFIAMIFEGDILGETGIFTELPRTANVIAKEESHLIQVPRRNFMSFIKKYPESGNKILLYIIYSLIHRLKEANQELAFDRQISLDQSEIDDFISFYMK